MTVLAACGASSSSSSSPDGDRGAPPPSAVVNPGDETQEEKDASTEVVFGIDAEDFRSQGFVLDQVEILAKVDGVVAAREKLSILAAPVFPHELRVQAPKSRPDASIELEVVVRDYANSPPIVQRHARTKFVKGKKLEQGMQCGHHVWLAARMKNLGQMGARTVLTASQPGTGLTVPATGFPFSYSPSANGSCELRSLRFQVDIAGAKATDFAGKPLDITLEATDKAGNKATTVRHVLIAPEIKTVAGLTCGT